MIEAKFQSESIKEANLIRRGLADPTVRALVKVIGALAALPTDRARVRALRLVEDRLAEQRAEATP